VAKALNLRILRIDRGCSMLRAMSVSMMRGCTMATRTLNGRTSCASAGEGAYRAPRSLPQQLWALYTGSHEAAMKAVSGVAVEIVLTVEASGGKRGGVPAAQAAGRRHRTAGTGGGR
jgi:hypothetical protein